MKIVVANWKSHPDDVGIAVELLDAYSKFSLPADIQVVVCPPALFATEVINHSFLCGIQDVAESETTQTGAITAMQVASVGIKYAIVGHSEQRARGETNSQVNHKIRQCLDSNITPIVCIGETIRDDSGEYVTELRSQIIETFAGYSRKELEYLYVAYEPVWAVGHDAQRECTPAECEEAVLLIQRELIDLTGNMPIGAIRILYGGSVTGDNARTYNTTGIEGFLVGRASLDPHVFRLIIEASR